MSLPIQDEFIEQQDKANFEETYVHQVYEQIASHFSQTRYKPWPVVESFLKTIPPGSLGADIGCGNGKNLVINKSLFTIGSDNCSEFISIVHSRYLKANHQVTNTNGRDNVKGIPSMDYAPGHCEGLLADNLSLPYRSEIFDFFLSIAVIHHFSTPERRQVAVKEIMRTIKKGGKGLIFVWALEQTDESKRNFEQQDVFVPWKLRKPPTVEALTEEEKKARKREKRERKKREKEMRKEEGDSIESLEASTSSLSVEESARKVEETEEVEEKIEKEDGKKELDPTYCRYYHMFRQGELDTLVEDTGMGRILQSGYDRDNWYVVVERA